MQIKLRAAAHQRMFRRSLPRLDRGWLPVADKNMRY
jgi:hypothetical protein